MNRPNPDNYWDIGGFKLSDYNNSLEEYCNYLEQQVELKERQRQKWEHDFKGIESYYKDRLEQKDKVLNEWIDECYKTWEVNSLYKKAIDKACEELQSLDYEIQKLQNPGAYDWHGKQAEQWKDWVLRDE